MLDASGAVIAGAKVTVKDEDTGLTATRRTAPVELNSTRVVDFQLQPATVSTQVTVIEEVPRLQRRQQRRFLGRHQSWAAPGSSPSTATRPTTSSSTTSRTCAAGTF